MDGCKAEHAEYREPRQLASLDPEEVTPCQAEDDQENQEGTGRAQLRQACGVHPVVEQVARHAAVQ